MLLRVVGVVEGVSSRALNVADDWLGFFRGRSHDGAWKQEDGNEEAKDKVQKRDGVAGGNQRLLPPRRVGEMRVIFHTCSWRGPGMLRGSM